MQFCYSTVQITQGIFLHCMIHENTRWSFQTVSANVVEGAIAVSPYASYTKEKSNSQLYYNLLQSCKDAVVPSNNIVAPPLKIVSMYFSPLLLLLTAYSLYCLFEKIHRGHKTIFLLLFPILIPDSDFFHLSLCFLYLSLVSNISLYGLFLLFASSGKTGHLSVSA